MKRVLPITRILLFLSIIFHFGAERIFAQENKENGEWHFKVEKSGKTDTANVKIAVYPLVADLKVQEEKITYEETFSIGEDLRIYKENNYYNQENYDEALKLLQSKLDSLKQLLASSNQKEEKKIQNKIKKTTDEIRKKKAEAKDIDKKTLKEITDEKQEIAKYNAIKHNHADLLIYPEIKSMILENDTILKVVVTGYCASYTNFRTVSLKDSLLLRTQSLQNNLVTIRGTEDYEMDYKFESTKEPAKIEKPEKPKREIENEHNKFSIHIGTASPIRTEFEIFNSKYASFNWGVNLGIKGKINIKKARGLGIIIGGDVYYHTPEKYYINAGTEYSGVMDINKWPHLFHVETTVGLNYKYLFNEKHSIWAEVAAGANGVYVTNSVSNVKEYNSIGNIVYQYDATSRYKLIFGFAYQAGIGYTINNRFSIGAHLYRISMGYGSAGQSTIRYRNYENPYGTEDYSYHSSIEKRYGGCNLLFVLRLGFHF